MNSSALQLALRETQRLLVSRTAWLIQGGVGVTLALSGPFDTVNMLSLPERLFYWPMVVVMTFVSGWFIEALVNTRPWVSRLNRIQRSVVCGVAIGIPVWLEMVILNRVFFGPAGFLPAEEQALLLRDILVIAIIVVGLLIFTGPLDRTRQPKAAGFTADTQAPRLLARLPFDKRGALVSLSVQDHYTEIVTTKGRELVLLRLSDAIAETEGCAGMQVHRSHWVALDHVASARRDGARAILTLKDAREVPVSRSYLADVKGAGLL